MKSVPKLEVVGNSKGKQRWWVRLVGANNKIMWATEKFDSLWKAQRAFDTHVALYHMKAVSLHREERRV